jgi:nicotinamidase-related amidase
MPNLPWELVFSESERAVYDLYRRPLGGVPAPGSAALLIVDATVEFLGRDAPVLEAAAELPTACGGTAWRAVEQIAALLDLFRGNGWPAIFTVPDWEAQPFVGAATKGPNRALPSGAGTMPPALQPAATEPVIKRSRPSAFFGTSLLALLIRSGIRSVVLAGGTTSGCIRASAVDGSSHGLDVFVVSRACFDRSDLSHAVALFELERRHAAIVSIEDLQP